MSGKEVKVGPRMKYLGLTPDRQLKLRPHFKLLAHKVTTSPNALRALLPNIGGAKIGVHRLHEGVASSRFVYGAPVWAQDLMKSRRCMKRPCYTIYDIKYISGRAHERTAVIRRNNKTTYIVKLVSNTFKQQQLLYNLTAITFRCQPYMHHRDTKRH